MNKIYFCAIYIYILTQGLNRSRQRALSAERLFQPNISSSTEQKIRPAQTLSFVNHIYTNSSYLLYLKISPFLFFETSWLLLFGAEGCRFDFHLQPTIVSMNMFVCREPGFFYVYVCLSVVFSP